MLISPTEPPELRRLGQTTLLVEEWGCDIAFPTEVGMVGIQRKEVGDLINSVMDGRLGKQLAQMQAVYQGVFIIEGRLNWSSDGKLLTRSNFTQAQYQGVMLSIQSQGYWILHTDSIQGTIDSVLNLEKWCHKHLTQTSVSSLLKPRKVSNEWGISTSREWAVSLLMHFDLGPILASRMFDKLGLPLVWTVQSMDLQRVKGIGKGRAEKMIRALETRTEEVG